MDMLKVENLRVQLPAGMGLVQAADDINLSIDEGESLCLIGETGCGKTIIALSLMRLLPPNAMTSGKILFRGKDLLSVTDEEMRRTRGRDISIIFEQPWTCLNPSFSVGSQIAEALLAHGRHDRREARQRALELMKLVSIGAPQKYYKQYPHELSGGMQQRIMIAMALALNPSLLIADEPTTALDVTVQAQIIELLKEVILGRGISLFLITHNLGVAAQLCDGVAVMYAGEIVEKGKLKEVFAEPKHPYTRLLLDAISDRGFKPIPGTLAELANLPNGCRFHPRCPYAMDVCRLYRPQMIKGVRCWLWKNW